MSFADATGADPLLGILENLPPKSSLQPVGRDSLLFNRPVFQPIGKERHSPFSLRLDDVRDYLSRTRHSLHNHGR
jgi:hypothetical protein